MIRVAAVGDLHYDRNRREELRVHFETLGDRADFLLLAGDLTQSGAVEEAQALADDLRNVRIPVLLVLGNHDYHRNLEDEISELFRSRGILVLEGNSHVLELSGNRRVGITGLKGFGGGFFRGCISEFGEEEMKEFARHARKQAEILRHQLRQLDADFKFVLLHYSPIEGTLLGERAEIFPFLGSYLLAEAIDDLGADAIFHGHAHHGVEHGMTPGGIPVRNVALPVIRRAYNLYSFSRAGGVA